MIPVALTIAGSDSGGGAGIQADLKTFAALEVFGTSAVTSITAQNTRGVTDIYDLPAYIVGRQLDAICSDFPVAAAKTGMLSTVEIIEQVAKKVAEHGIPHLVVDPVMVAKSGDPLLRPEAVLTLVTQLFPLATVITPNRPEAEVLLGERLRSRADLAEAARALKRLGPKSVLIKGGHGRGRAVDLFFDGRTLTELASERLDQRNTHGTGCILAAATAAHLARGASLAEAVSRAKGFVTEAIRHGLAIGGGTGPADPLATTHQALHRAHVLASLQAALERLKTAGVGPLVPEVQSNLGYALPEAQDRQEVAAFPGRLHRVGETLRELAPPAFGASRHVASIILAAMRHDPSVRAAMNLRYEKALLAACRKAKLAVGTFDRANEPSSVRRREGASLEWGTREAIRQAGRVPDVIYDTGGHGKEPMLRILGRSPEA
ncbi:MAG: bifunctional hydroxymethylpyrimidine kinase/phosphomethylpyrimidine kinase, partial [Nitrospinota bacterium]